MRELAAPVRPDEIVGTVGRAELTPVFVHAGVSPSRIANAIAGQMEERLESTGRDRNGVFETFARFNPGGASSVGLADAPVRAKHQRGHDKKQPANQTQELHLRSTERVRSGHADRLAGSVIG